VVERDGVVDVGTAGGSIAAREASRPVATPDPALQHRRQLVAHRFGNTDRRAFDRQPRRRFSELTHLLGINHPVALLISVLAVPGDSGLTCDHVDHRALPAGGTSVSAPRVGQSGRPQSHASARPAHNAVTASARRWAMVRESLPHTEVAISENRLSCHSPLTRKEVIHRWN